MSTAEMSIGGGVTAPTTADYTAEMHVDDEVITLTTADYVVFSVLLAASAGIGIYFLIRDWGSKQAVENYLLGKRGIPWLAAGFSGSLTFVSAVSVLGIPAEMMYYGATYIWFILGTVMSTIIGCEVFLPVYYKNNMSSPYQYYDLRFGKVAKTIATLVYILQSVLYTGVMMYGPALTLNAVSNFSLWGGLLSVGFVCILYTTLGGLKAVVWTDVIQGILLAIVLTVILFMSAVDVGGFDAVWQACREGGRINFFRFEFDPRYRMTFWSAVFGIGTMWISLGASNQAVVQRFLCCNSISSGKKATYLAALIGDLLTAGLFVMGFIMYAYFKDCDPLANKTISAGDQALPYMVLRVLRDLPGMSGLFVAGLFAAGLSTVSSSLNGMSCVTLEDLIKPHVNWSERVLLWTSRGLTLTYGLLCIVFAYASSLLDGLIASALSLLGLCAGPLLGPLFLGMMFPFTNSYGATCGMISAMAVSIWIYVGSLYYRPPPKFVRLLNVSTAGCPIIPSSENSTVLWTITSPITTAAVPEERPPIADLYALSFGYYSLIGLFVCIIIAVPVSIATGGWKNRHDVDPNLIYLPFEHPLLSWLPEGFRRLVRPRFNTPMNEQQQDEENHTFDGTKVTESADHTYEVPTEYKYKKEITYENDNLAYYWNEDTITTTL